MKKNLLMLTVFLFLLTSFSIINIAGAQQISQPEFKTYTPPGKIDMTEVRNELKESDLSGIRIGLPSFEDKIYNQKDIVKVKLPLNNNSNTDYSDVSISAYIVVHSKSSATGNYGYQNNLSQVFLSKKTSKDITFQFKMPDSISFKNGDVARIEIIALSKTGQTLGISGGDIKLGTFLKSLNIVEASLKANNKDYALQQGPTVPSDKFPQLVIKLQNKNSEDITFIPKLKVYDLQPSRPEVGNKQYATTTIKAGATKSLILDLPVFSKAGVYDGQMTFVDNLGNEKASFVSSRWIVDGDMATISNVNIDKTTVKKGEKAVVTVLYTGSPVDIDTGSIADVGNGLIKITLFNESKEVIAIGEKQINLNTLSGSVSIDTMVEKDASSVGVNIVIAKGDKELANYSTLLTDPSPKESDNTNYMKYLILCAMAVLLIIVLIVIFIRKQKMSSKLMSVAILLGCVSLFGFRINVAHADFRFTPVFRWDPPICSGMTCISGPDGSFGFGLYSHLDKTTFSPNEEMGYDIYTQPYAYVCYNTNFPASVVYSIYDSNGNLVSSYTASNDTSPIGGEANEWLIFPAFSPKTANKTSTSVPAPLTPGQYILRMDTSVAFASGGSGWKYFGSAYNNGTPMINTFAFEVVGATTSDAIVLTASASNLTTSTAKINWTYTSTKPQINYEVDVYSNPDYSGLVGVKMGTTSTYLTSADYSIYNNTRSVDMSGLSPNTTYYVKVWAASGGNSSVYSWSVPATTVFTTLVDPSLSFSLSCLANPDPVATGTQTTFTAYPVNNSGAVNYLWSGAVTGSGFSKSTSFSSPGNYSASLTGTDGSGANFTATCSVRAGCDNSHVDGDTECPLGIEYQWRCQGTSWVQVPTGNSCGEGGSSTTTTAYVDCLPLDGFVVASGTTKTFYKDRISKQCDGRPAKCVAGKLVDAVTSTDFASTTYKFKSCVVPGFGEF